MVFLFLLAFAACTHAQRALLPIHGCEWVPETTAIINFTLSENTSNNSAPTYVQWQAPAFRIVCNASAVEKPGVRTDVPCTQDNSRQDTPGTLQLSAGNESSSNATLNFKVFAQCAASQFAIYYQAVVALACEKSLAGTTACVPKGNATATVWATEYL